MVGGSGVGRQAPQVAQTSCSQAASSESVSALVVLPIAFVSFSRRGSVCLWSFWEWATGSDGDGTESGSVSAVAGPETGDESGEAGDELGASCSPKRATGSSV